MVLWNKTYWCCELGGLRCDLWCLVLRQGLELYLQISSVRPSDFQFDCVRVVDLWAMKGYEGNSFI